MSDPVDGLVVLPLRGIPELGADDDLAAHLLGAVRAHGGLRDGDVLVVSSKVVSKTAGLRVGRDDRRGREGEVLRRSRRVVAERATPAGTTRVVESEAGPVMAAAGIDASNTGPEGGLLLLPADPDAAAAALHRALARDLPPGTRFGVLLTDTAGRPWRAGQTDLALGAHGLAVVDDLRGGTDHDGRPLAVTTRAVGDELAAAADLVKGKADGVPAALLRGPAVTALVEGTDTGRPGPPGGASGLVRTGPGDWFALGHREAVRAALGVRPGTPLADEVGIASVAPEEDEARGARAVRVALVGHAGATIDGSAAQGFAVSAPDPVLAGRVAARLEVALAGEDLASDVHVRKGHVVADAPAGPTGADGRPDQEDPTFPAGAT
ncbi:coenzyme F420-0:L-glutamate ligase [Ornithinimicrobium sp. W1665]|uniref:coenzyme F420-0:L-glutamate ligase n=1 Tax=Ornithinimicrobium sp. W1665 TaxID=3416666 RepID=UPI003CEB6E4E